MGRMGGREISRRSFMKGSALGAGAAAAAVLFDGGTANAVIGGSGRLDRHVRAFDDIARRAGGNRASMTQGFEDSARYIEEALQGSRWGTWRQEFEYRVSIAARNRVEVRSPEAITLTSHLVGGVSASPIGGVSSPLAIPADGTGDSADSWASQDVVGAVALVRIDPSEIDSLLDGVRRRLQYAAAAGIAAVLVYLYDLYVPIDFEEPEDRDLLPCASIPAFEAEEIGELAHQHQVMMHVDLELRIENRHSFNLLAGSREVPPTRLFGAHLDSVPEGPGINDNAAAAAVLLETAQRQDQRDPNVRFAWWGAHEDGLNGSEHYVNTITGTPDLEQLAAYINLEIVGSLNYVVSMFVDGAGTEKSITDHFTAVGQPWLVFPPGASLGSDHLGFAAAGVPYVSLSSYFTGDGKTEEEAALFGGTVGAPYNPNYHNPQDDYANVNLEVVEIITAAVAAASEPS